MRSRSTFSENGIADALNESGAATKQGGTWHAVTIQNVLRVYEAKRTLERTGSHLAVVPRNVAFNYNGRQGIEKVRTPIRSFVRFWNHCGYRGQGEGRFLAELPCALCFSYRRLVVAGRTLNPARYIDKGASRIAQ